MVKKVGKRKIGGKYYNLAYRSQDRESAELKAKFYRRVHDLSARVIKGGKSLVTKKQIWEVWVTKAE